MTTYELIDQTGEQFGRNRQWLIVISDGHRKRGFCTVPLWEDFPAIQLKADAQHVLRQLQAYDETATIDRLRAQVAELVQAGQDALGVVQASLANARERKEYPAIIANLEYKETNLRAAIAAAESEPTNAIANDYERIKSND